MYLLAFNCVHNILVLLFFPQPYCIQGSVHPRTRGRISQTPDKGEVKTGEKGLSSEWRTFPSIQ